MPGRQAKTLSASDLNDLLVFASCTRQPLRNTVMVLLSAKAGLRAGEIANVTWDMVVDANGQISGLIELVDNAAKKCSGRTIPVHPDLAAASAAWRQVAPPSDHVIASERGGRMRPLSIVVWFNRAFKDIGLRGCSSHSGRRTFVTRAARIVHKAGGSLRDVQLLAGHSCQLTRGRCFRHEYRQIIIPYKTLHFLLFYYQSTRPSYTLQGFTFSFGLSARERFARNRPRRLANRPAHLLIPPLHLMT
jgi:integrase